jgi:hypothetical protein
VDNGSFSNLAYTQHRAENKGHVDNDISTYTFGVGGNAWSNGKFSILSDGYGQSGGGFYTADYATIVHYDQIDGVCEQIWQVPAHIHSTIKGSIPSGFTQFGGSAQINFKLSRPVEECMRNPGTKYVMADIERA